MFLNIECILKEFLENSFEGGAGCSITSTATVSTTGVTGCFTFRAAFFAGAGLGLAPATVRFVAFPFAAFVTLRALPRLAELPLRSFARFCTFDCFLRTPPSRAKLSNCELSTDRS